MSGPQCTLCFFIMGNVLASFVMLSVLTLTLASEMCTGDDFVFDLLQSDRMISRQVLFTPRSPLRPARMVMDEVGERDKRCQVARSTWSPGAPLQTFLHL